MADLRQLVRAAQEGDVDACGEIVRQFQSSAYAQAFAVLGDTQLAEDSAQEAFLDAFRLLGELREPEAFPGWLRRIVRTRCGRILRRRRLAATPLEGMGDPPSADETGETCARDDEHRCLREAVQSLSEAQRETVVLFYLREQSLAQVGEALDVPVGTVKKRLHDARVRLKERMLEMVGENLQQSAPVPEAKADEIRFLLALAGQLEEGVPVVRALRTMREGIGSDCVRGGIDQIMEGIARHGTIHHALACGDLTFPPMVLALIRDGERFGVLETTSRLAGEWLRTGKCSVPPHLYQGFTSPIHGILHEAAERRAVEVTVAPPPPDATEFRAVFRFADGSEAESETSLLAKHMPGIEIDLKRHTVLDAKQAEDELVGTVRVPWSGMAKQFVWRVAYCPRRESMGIRLALP
jgi:RNA polymerase sigma factor (sigma-70 family)